MTIDQKIRLFACALLVHGAAACAGEQHAPARSVVSRPDASAVVRPAPAEAAHAVGAASRSSESAVPDATVRYPLAEIGGRGFARRPPASRAAARRPTIDDIEAPPPGSGATALAAHLLARMDTTAEAPRRLGRAAQTSGPERGTETRRDPNGPCELVARAADVRLQRIPGGRRLLVSARRAGDLAELRLRLHALEAQELRGRDTEANAPSSGCGLVDLGRRGHHVNVTTVPGGVYVDIVPEHPSRLRVLDRELSRTFGARALRAR
jgi:hypothetical protein